MPLSPGDRAVKLAGRLLELGISRDRVIELLSHPHDEIENQLDWLPFRKAKRPGAFLIDAVRHKYKPPKEFYYAKDSIKPAREAHSVDQDTKPRDR